jgi:hypothetical protein
MALVDALREPDLLSPEVHEKYSNQLVKNRKRLSELADHSEVNYRMYQKVVVSNKKKYASVVSNYLTLLFFFIGSRGVYFRKRYGTHDQIIQ